MTPVDRVRGGLDRDDRIPRNEVIQHCARGDAQGDGQDYGSLAICCQSPPEGLSSPIPLLTWAFPAFIAAKRLAREVVIIFCIDERVISGLNSCCTLLSKPFSS